MSGLGVLVQARMGSERLPGKVLMDLAGRPVLGRVVERVSAARAPGSVTVCTSDSAEDQAVADFCASAGVDCARGPREDVAARLLEAARGRGLEAFVRVSGDSPLIDPAVIDRGVDLFRSAGKVDLVSNVFPRRTFPRGQSVEVVRTDALARALDAMSTADDREHVTPYLYANPDAFRVVGFASEGDFADVRLVIDTEEDHRRIGALIARMDRPLEEYGWREIAELAPRPASGGHG